MSFIKSDLWHSLCISYIHTTYFDHGIYTLWLVFLLYLLPNFMCSVIFFLLLLIDSWVQLALLINTWVWSHSLGHRQPNSCHIPQREWHLHPLWPSSPNNSCANGEVSGAFPLQMCLFNVMFKYYQKNVHRKM